jgi:hypothetical protein
MVPLTESLTDAKPEESTSSIPQTSESGDSFDEDDDAILRRLLEDDEYDFDDDR